jgi:hypothetical protein
VGTVPMAGALTESALYAARARAIKKNPGF